jgi:hypothetical protein
MPEIRQLSRTQRVTAPGMTLLAFGSSTWKLATRTCSCRFSRDSSALAGSGLLDAVRRRVGGFVMTHVVPVQSALAAGTPSAKPRAHV